MGEKFYNNLTKNELEKMEPYSTIPLLKGINIDKGMDVLDIGGFGCGGLNTSIFFVKKECNIDAMNNDSSVKDLCDNFGVNFINADIFNYDSDKKYDIIISELLSEGQIKMLTDGHIDRIIDMLKPNGIFLSHFTDDLNRFPKGDNWVVRKTEMTPFVVDFKEGYCGGKAVEDVVTFKYNAEYLGEDTNRFFMKWFKFFKDGE